MSNNNDTSVKYFLQTFFESCKILFSKKNESKLQEDLNIKKGFLQNLKYLMFLFLTFPLKIFNVILKLDYNFYFFIERFVLVFLTYFKDDIYKVLGTNYERYVKTQINQAQDVITADIQTIQYIINFYRLFRISVAVIVLLLLILIVYFGAIVFSLVFSAFFGAASTTTLVLAGVGGESILIGFIIKIILFVAIFLAVLILVAHLLYAAVKIVLISIQSFQSVKSDDLAQFIVLVLDYTILKTKELYSEEVAKNALFMLLENFKSKKSDITVDDNVLIDFLEEYKLLENKKEKEEVKNENNGIK